MNSKREMLTIERRDSDYKSIIASVPFETGVYPTRSGELDVRVHSPDGQGHQKVILNGVVPTIQQRGKKGQFHRISGKRRVVDFPPRHDRLISQDNGSQGTLIFTREPFVQPEALAAD